MSRAAGELRERLRRDAPGGGPEAALWSYGVPPTPREDFRDIVMVCGTDPYAYKGLEDRTRAFVRAESREMLDAMGAKARAAIAAKAAREAAGDRR